MNSSARRFSGQRLPRAANPGARWRRAGRALLVATLAMAAFVPRAQAVATFEGATGDLKLPFVQVPGLGDFDVDMILVGAEEFLLTRAESLAEDDPARDDTSPAAYSLDTEILDIPVVDVVTPKGAVVPFAAQLTRVPGSNPLRFVLSSATQITDDDGAGSVEGVLQSFNVDTSETARVDQEGEPLPDDFSPLGASAAVNVTQELFITGITPDGEAVAAAFLDVQPEGAQVPPAFAFNILSAPSADSAPWAVDPLGSRSTATAQRATAAADLDGDGLQETVVIYTGVDDGSDLILATVFQDEEEGLVQTDPRTVAFDTSAGDVNAVGADVDGDGVDEVVVALTQADAVQVWVLFQRDAGLTLDEDYMLSLPRNVEGTGYTSLAVGNLDFDRPQEIALVLTELTGSETGISRYHILDPVGGGLESVASAVVQGSDDLGVPKTAVTADVSLGDIDGDGLDEIVMAGLENIESGGGCESFGHVFVAFDDLNAGMEELGSDYFTHFFRNCPSFSAWRLRYVHVNTPDLDGDGVAEIQANQFFFQNFANLSVIPAFTLIDGVAIPEADMFEVGDFGWFDRSTSSIEAGDVTNDGRDNVVYYAQNSNEMSVWGIDELDAWSRMTTIPADFENAQTPDNPRILLVNLDTDGPILKYEEGDYEFVFTEPVIIAAMAAPPCLEDVGQNTGDCVTRYGTAETVSIDGEVSATVSAGVHAGFKGEVKVFGIGAEIEKVRSFTLSATASVLAAYELTKERTFTSGPLEDSVIFTTIPYDRYTYRIASHPNPDLVGEEIVISLPREPITIMAERGFYNRTVADEGIRIDESVFSHTPGDLDSYPTEAQKNALLDNWWEDYRSEIESLGDVGDDILDALESLSLESETESVDQGGGSREVTLITNQSFGVGVGVAAEMEVSVTGAAGGKILGFSKGVSTASSLQVSKGTSTLYGGGVGAISGDGFGENQYNYGLFVYTHEDAATGQEFEVINYWVER